MGGWTTTGLLFCCLLFTTNAARFQGGGQSRIIDPVDSVPGPKPVPQSKPLIGILTQVMHSLICSQVQGRWWTHQRTHVTCDARSNSKMQLKLG